MNSVPQPLDTLSLPASARLALGRKGVTEISDLLLFTENEISSLSGVGRKALEVLQTELRRHNLSFREAE
jgi:DNA-directed RNA polymerase alpha subunit